MSKKKNEKRGDSSKDNERICAALSYLLVGIIWFFADENMRKKDFVKYHVKQGLVLFIACLIISAIWSIPLFGLIVAPILNVILIILIIIGIVNALNMQKKKIPIIGEFGEKFSF